MRKNGCMPKVLIHLMLLFHLVGVVNLKLTCKSMGAYPTCFASSVDLALLAFESLSEANPQKYEHLLEILFALSNALLAFYILKTYLLKHGCLLSVLCLFHSLCLVGVRI